MKPVVKYGVYLDILLMGSNYVIKYEFLLSSEFPRLSLEDMSNAHLDGVNLAECASCLTARFDSMYLTTGFILDFQDNVFT